MATAANKDTCRVKVAAEELAAIELAAIEGMWRSRRKKGTMIAQYSAFAILLIFCLVILVFAGEERGQDKGE